MALWRPADALLAAFAGAAVGSIFHTAAHFMDHDLGGKDSEGRPIRTDRLSEGDLLVVRGPAGQAAEVAQEFGLAFRKNVPEGEIADQLFNRDSGLAEVLIPPRSPLIGERFFPGRVFRHSSGGTPHRAVSRRRAGGQ